MTSTAATPRPLVAVLSRTPLVYEALAGALGGLVTLRRFDADGTDTEGLLTALAPDAVIVDSDDAATKAISFAGSAQTPVLHVGDREASLRLYADGRWRELTGEATSDLVRNTVLGALYGRRQG